MTKINNTQRSAFARMLTEAKNRLHSSDSGTLRINRYAEFADETNPRLVALIKKHQLIRLDAAKDAAEKALETAREKADDELDSYNAECRSKRAAELQAMADAIREVWAAETVEDAKAIVATFVKV